MKNWIKKIEEILINNYITKDVHGTVGGEEKDIINAMLEFGNLIFEATKKKAADEAKVDRKDYSSLLVNIDSILNIEKPNL